MANAEDGHKETNSLSRQQYDSYGKTDMRIAITIQEEEGEVARCPSRRDGGKPRAFYCDDEEIRSQDPSSGTAAVHLSNGPPHETTPLLRPDRHADDGDDASGDNQSSINWRRHLKIRCTNSAQIFNIIALSIILFGGVIVSVWLYIDRPGNTQSCDERCMLHLTTRQDWGAEPPRKNISRGARPAVYVIISHTVTSPCNSSVACKSELKAMQLNNFKRNFTDIKYSFLVGGDGFTYEGRGFEAENAIAPHFDPTSLGIAFIGNFESVTPPEEQLNQAKSLIQEALYQQKLSHDYKLVAHRQVAHTESPGFALFSIIKTWKHWENCYMESC